MDGLNLTGTYVKVAWQDAITSLNQFCANFHYLINEASVLCEYNLQAHRNL